MTTPKWGTVREAAEHWRVCPDTMRRWIRDGLVQSKATPGGQKRPRKLVLLVDPMSVTIARVLAPSRKKKKTDLR